MNKVSLWNEATLEKVLLSLLLIVCLFLSINSAFDGGDFDVYLEAAYKLYHGQNPYLPPYSKNGMGYSYSPFFIMLLIPFTYNYFITELVWCLLSFWFIYRSFIIFEKYLDLRFMNRLTYMKYVMLLVVLSFQFMSNNIGMVQVTPFLIWIIFESINLIHSGKNILGGILLGIGINIKILPIVFIGYLFYRGYFMALIACIVCFIGLYFVPSIFWGYEYNLTLLSDWWVIINPTSKEHQVEIGIGTHSMVAFLPVYLSDTGGELLFKRNIFNMSIDSAIIVTNLASLFLVACSLLYFRCNLFIREKFKVKALWEICYFMLLIPLIFPHQQKYAFLFAIPMVAYILYFIFRTFGLYKNLLLYRFVVFTFGFVMIVYSPIHGSDIIGGDLFKLSQHYRLITIATLILIPISLYCNPQKLLSLVTDDKNK